MSFMALLYSWEGNVRADKAKDDAGAASAKAAEARNIAGEAQQEADLAKKGVFLPPDPWHTNPSAKGH
jgi:hypothetical protein